MTSAVPRTQLGVSGVNSVTKMLPKKTITLGLARFVLKPRRQASQASIATTPSAAAARGCARHAERGAESGPPRLADRDACDDQEGGTGAHRRHQLDGANAGEGENVG